MLLYTIKQLVGTCFTSASFASSLLSQTVNTHTQCWNVTSNVTVRTPAGIIVLGVRARRLQKHMLMF